MAVTWFLGCWRHSRVSACRPSYPCPTAASRGCRAPPGKSQARPQGSTPAGARPPSAWSCLWGKETVWGWWRQRASWPPPDPGRSSPPSVPSSCTLHRPRDNWSSAWERQQGLDCSQTVALEEKDKWKFSLIRRNADAAPPLWTREDLQLRSLYYYVNHLHISTRNRICSETYLIIKLPLFLVYLLWKFNVLVLIN